MCGRMLKQSRKMKCAVDPIRWSDFKIQPGDYAMRIWLDPDKIASRGLTVLVPLLIYLRLSDMWKAYMHFCKNTFKYKHF